MTKTEKMQKLHILSTQGNSLSDEEKRQLNDWYAKLDDEESIINKNNRQIEVNSLKSEIEQTNKQIIKVSDEISDLLKQNEQIRLENQKIRQQIESRLAEQIA